MAFKLATKNGDATEMCNRLLYGNAKGGSASQGLDLPAEYEYAAPGSKLATGSFARMRANRR